MVTTDILLVLKIKGGDIVGHVLRELSRAHWYTVQHIRHGGTSNLLQGNWKQKAWKWIKVPCVYKIVESDKLVQRMKNLTSSKKNHRPNQQH